jgi:hypothetical protein
MHLGKPNDKIIMDNPETLETLVTQDTSLIMIDTDSLWNRQSFLIYGENEHRLEILNSFIHIALVLISACMTIDY